MNPSTTPLAAPLTPSTQSNRDHEHRHRAKSQKTSHKGSGKSSQDVLDGASQTGGRRGQIGGDAAKDGRGAVGQPTPQCTPRVD
jgi:hypothetical protein